VRLRDDSTGLHLIPQARLLAVARSVVRFDGVAQVQILELGKFRQRVVLGRVADQGARVRDVEPLETIIAEPVQEGEADVLDIDAARDELV